MADALANAKNTFEGFSVSHAAILNGTTGADDADIYGIREGTLDVDSDTFDNTGDDTVLSSWGWVNFANLSISSGYIPLEVISMLSGSTIASSGTAEATTWSIPLWNEASMNQPALPVRLRIPSKDASGAPRLFDIILYKVQFAPFAFEGPAYKDGLVINYTGKAMLSNYDEKGAALTERAVGRLLWSIPVGGNL